jgi:hypothetical protein
VGALDTPFNHEAIRSLTGLRRTLFPDQAAVHDLEFGFDNTAEPPKHSVLAANWPLSYEFFGTGDKDLNGYFVAGYVECCNAEGPAFVPSTTVGQNTVPKDATRRRRALDCSHPRDGTVAVGGKLYASLSLNSRIDIANQAEVEFSCFEGVAAKAMLLAHSQLPVHLFKTDGGAWYKQFFRRLSCVGSSMWAL